MAEKSKKQTKKPKVMDVAKPGKSAPSASSRPIIVGHKPTVHDPMVNEDKEMPSGESEEHKIDVKRTGPKVIAPISPVEELKDDKEADTPDSTDTSEVTTDEPKETETPETVETEEPANDDAPEPESEASNEETEPETADEEPVEPEETTDEDTGKESKDKKDSKDKGSSIVDAIAGQAAKNKDKKTDKKNEELQKRLAEIEKLVDEKKYFVPTSSTTKKERKTRWAILLLSLILLAGAYLAFDAQLIKNDYWLPYHFFKEEKKQKSDSTTPSKPATSEKTESPTEESAKLKEFISKESGISFMHPEGWLAEIKANEGSCPVLSGEFEGQQNNETNPIGCPHSGSVWLGEKTDAKRLASVWVFTGSTKDLNTIYDDQVSSLSSQKHETFKTDSGLNAFLVNQPLSATGNVYSDNIYVVELAPGMYLWLSNREYVTGEGDPDTDASAGQKNDLRAHSPDIRKLVESIKFSKP